MFASQTRIRLLLIVAGPLLLSNMEMLAENATRARFHHVHLNVTNKPETLDFYTEYFGANRVNFKNQTQALFTEKSFILLNEVSSPPKSHLDTCLWHIGWAGVDGPSEFRWRKEKGAKIHTPLTPFGNEYYMYFQGPNEEVVEVYTGSRNHRFDHLHLLASDVNETIHWFLDTLLLKTNRRTVPQPSRDLDPNSLRGIWVNSIQVDNVNLVVFGKPRPGTSPFWAPKELQEEFAPTEGSAIDHIAFSFRSIEPEFNRMQQQGVVIKEEISVDPSTGLKHFLVLAPDNLLVEIVEARPIPEGIWD
jgi:catechol 2,3-dioxygenase-like lactoylglutathione lyase family enzyme